MLIRFQVIMMMSYSLYMASFASYANELRLNKVKYMMLGLISVLEVKVLRQTRVTMNTEKFVPRERNYENNLPK